VAPTPPLGMSRSRLVEEALEYWKSLVALVGKKAETVQGHLLAFEIA
jgi:hypothetical protein